MKALRKEGIAGHNAKLARYTKDYGVADPDAYMVAPGEELKEEGPEDVPEYGADSSTAKPRGDRPARRTSAANPIATYKKGGRVADRMKARCRAEGGALSPILAANEAQKSANPERAVGGSVSGSIQGRARGGRLRMGKGKNKGTNVTVVVAPQTPPAASAGLPPPLAGLGAAPPGPPPPKPPEPLMGPPGGPPPGGLPMGAPGGMPPGLIPPRARGGKVAHSDEKEDKSLVKEMVKPSALKRADGGKVVKVGLTAGSATGEGRLEKEAVRARRKAGDKAAEC